MSNEERFELIFKKSHTNLHRKRLTLKGTHRSCLMPDSELTSSINLFFKARVKERYFEELIEDVGFDVE